MTIPASFYEILNISPSSSDEDVKRAYHAMAKKHHPDLHPHNKRLAELRFRAISEAYAGLKTRENRARYNQMLRAVSEQCAQNDNKKPGGLFEKFTSFFRPNTGQKA